jgi:hypothetical protein
MAATIEGAPNIAAIPAATPIIKPQETLPEKKPMPTAIIANAANVLPAEPVTILKALHITRVREFELTLYDALDIFAFAFLINKPPKAGVIESIEAIKKNKVKSFNVIFFMIFN